MPSFDIVSELPMHEVTNAVDQASREVGQRFDFKGTNAKFELKDHVITLSAPADFQLKQMIEILKLKLAKRGIDLSGGVFDILEQECSQQISSNVAHLKASCGDEAIRAAMRLAPGEAMLLLDEICFNRLCHPVMRSLSYYTNFFDFSILRKLL